MGCREQPICGQILDEGSVPRRRKLGGLFNYFVSGDLATPWRIAALAGMEASHDITSKFRPSSAPGSQGCSPGSFTASAGDQNQPLRGGLIHYFLGWSC
jgi:hypothetical protein